MNDEKNSKSGNTNPERGTPSTESRGQHIDLGKAINKGNVPQMLNPPPPPKKK